MASRRWLGGASRRSEVADAVDSQTAVDVVTHRRFRYLRHYARGLSLLGLLFGWMFFVVSLTPSLLPRSWQAQGLVSGNAVAQGYGVGVVLAWAGRRIGVPGPGEQLRRRAWQALGLAALFTVPIILWLSSSWQSDIRRAVGAPATGRYLYLGVSAVAASLTVVIIGLARLLYDAYCAVAARLVRFLPQFVSRLIATALIVALVVGLATGFAEQILLRLANATASATSRGTDPGVSQPSSALRSGSPASLVTWDSLSRKGRAFVGSGPTVADLERLTARTAIEPIRVYAGVASAKTLRDEADLALRELKRTGAFERALLAVATTTGSGWVDATLVDPLEYMYGGDTAIAAIQYSYLPSWISFLTERARARQAGRELFDTIYDYWSTLPAAHRPRLVVCGESLGAYGAEAAFSGIPDITTRTSGALFAGPPNSTGLWRELTDRRAKGSPEWRPIYLDGRTVRFAASAGDLRQPDGTLRHPSVVYLQHASDPIVWWSTDLVVRRPDWLTEPRGPDVARQMHWFPFVTFWQVTGDLIVGNQVPAGHGHRYGSEIPTAWAAILHPPSWTDADTARLSASQATANGA
jgi:uncharacterized membrane protein